KAFKNYVHRAKIMCGRNALTIQLDCACPVALVTRKAPQRDTDGGDALYMVQFAEDGYTVLERCHRTMEIAMGAERIPKMVERYSDRRQVVALLMQRDRLLVEDDGLLILLLTIRRESEVGQQRANTRRLSDFFPECQRLFIVGGCPS